ncbi:MAG TPA: DNA cytosine methyltransferase [Planctomycetota bacterium]|nr:DNA cytosine methyltransferase [Planctomycetota bacterium]
MLKAIDFFCGAGGLTRGLLDAGIDVRAGVDIDSTLKRTYEENNVPSRFVQQDVKDIDINALRRSLGIRKSDFTLYAACTPCQPFSTLNQRQGRDSRKSLLLRFGKLITLSPPHLLIVENVPGLHTAYGRWVYARFVALLNRAGFKHRFEEMLDAYDYGVPQVRRRFIMIASRIGEVARPRKSSVRRTVRDAISHLPRLEAGQVLSEIDGHLSRALTPEHARLIRSVPRNGGSRQDIDQSLLLDCHKNRPKVHRDVFGRMAWDAPAPTLTCRCTDVYCGRFVHPEQDRGLSVREAAALQSFPDGYKFFGASIFRNSTHIGNAVPVALARRLGRAAIRSLESHIAAG